MELNIDSLQEQIPYYLTQEAKQNLVKALNEFPNVNYYTSLFPDDVLQGDGWSGFGVIDYVSEQKKTVKGLILSNSCDIDPNNNRDYPPKIIFTPIIKLSSYVDLLQKNKVLPNNLDEKVKAIQNQLVTSIFYLPKGGKLEEDYIALLDDVHSISYKNFISNSERNKLFTLSQIGFYLFLFKVSVHFCRFHENINRDIN